MVSCAITFYRPTFFLSNLGRLNFTLDVVLVELVALLYRTEASVLADGPRSVRIHCGVWPPCERHHSWQLLSKVLCVSAGVQWLDGDPFWSMPHQVLSIFPFQLLFSYSGPLWV